MKYEVKFTAEMDSCDVAVMKEMFADVLMREQMLIPIDEDSLSISACDESVGLFDTVESAG